MSAHLIAEWREAMQYLLAVLAGGPKAAHRNEDSEFARDAKGRRHDASIAARDATLAMVDAVRAARADVVSVRELAGEDPRHAAPPHHHAFPLFHHRSARRDSASSGSTGCTPLSHSIGLPIECPFSRAWKPPSRIPRFMASSSVRPEIEPFLSAIGLLLTVGLSATTARQPAQQRQP